MFPKVRGQVAIGLEDGIRVLIKLSSVDIQSLAEGRHHQYWSLASSELPVPLELG